MKIREFQQILGKKGSDFALFYTADSSRVNANLPYFSGYTGIGALVIPKKSQPFLMAPEMEIEKAKKSSIGRVYSMETLKNQRFFGHRKFKKFSREKRFFESIYAMARKNHIKTKNIAIDKNNFTLNAYKHLKKQFRGIKSKDIALDCLKLRETKTAKEIRYLKKSCHYADKILQKAIKNFKSLRTEAEIAAFLDYETKKLGLELSFDPIVASGSNGSMPHHVPLNVKIKKGFCVLDFGVKHKGYCSDITRTVYFGNPSKKEKEIYNMLLNVQQGAISEIGPNKKCSEIYDFVAKSLGKYSRYFTHGLGHGVGVEIHELPNLTLNSKDRITNSKVFTIEPGIYLPGKFGIRIEDTVMFDRKTAALTTTSKDLLII